MAGRPTVYRPSKVVRQGLLVAVPRRRCRHGSSLSAWVALELKGGVADANASESFTRGSQNGTRIGARRCLEMGGYNR